MENIAAISPTPDACATTALVIPLQNHEEFYALPAAERERVQVLMRIYHTVLGSQLGRVAALRLAASANAMSFKTLSGHFYAYHGTKDWRVFARRYRGPQQLPDDFVDEMRRRMLGNGRSMKQAIQSLRDDFRAGREIPGYGTWQSWYAKEYPERDLPAVLSVFPAGWSNSNLYGKAPTKAQRALKTRGWLAAKRYLPHVMRDMSLLRFM